MEENKEELLVWKEQLIRAETERNKLKKKVPEGARLHASRYNDSYQYFMRMDGTEKKGVYIRKSNMELAELLAQIEYDDKLITVLKKAIYRKEKYMDLFRMDPFSEAKQMMTIGKQQLIHMPYEPDDVYIQNWKAQEFEHLPFSETIPEYYAGSGLRVRSKTEIIIADMLEEMDIPFFYEKPLRLKAGLVHPDFTLLDIRNRREVYWEHFGMMDDPEYRDHTFSKILSYEASGIFQGDGLIWTFETSKYPINTRNLRKMLTSLKKKLGY